MSSVPLANDLPPLPFIQNAYLLPLSPWNSPSLCSILHTHFVGTKMIWTAGFYSRDKSCDIS